VKSKEISSKVSHYVILNLIAESFGGTDLNFKYRF